MKELRILVVGGFQAGSQYAHAINTVKMAQGFARLGHKVGIVCRNSDDAAEKSSLSSLYGLDHGLDWFFVPAWSGEKRYFAAFTMLKVRRFAPDLVYARNYLLPVFTSRFGIPTVVETHAHPSNKSKTFGRMVNSTRRKRFQRVVTISHYLADHYASIGVPEEKLTVLPDAVDLNLFSRPDQLPGNPYDSCKKNVVYAGHLYDYKGIPSVLDAAGRLPDIMFHFVGGWPEDQQRQTGRVASRGLKNVRFHGLQPHAEVPRYLWHADALLLPPSQNHPSAKWTSPVKLGEYLAAEVPVVATRIPALEAWVDDRQVEFASPDDGVSLAAAVERVLTDETRRDILIANGRKLASSLSYKHRAKQILERALPAAA